MTRFTPIVYVDNDSQSRKDFREAVRLTNKVDYLSYGQELLSRIAHDGAMRLGPPRIILIAESLPDGRGEDIIEKIREYHKHMDLVPLILVYSSEFPPKTKADWLIGKPITALAIMDALTHVTQAEMGIIDRRQEQQ